MLETFDSQMFLPRRGERVRDAEVQRTPRCHKGKVFAGRCRPSVPPSVTSIALHLTSSLFVSGVPTELDVGGGRVGPPLFDMHLGAAPAVTVRHTLSSQRVY